jgi:hypothetical protein
VFLDLWQYLWEESVLPSIDTLSYNVADIYPLIETESDCNVWGFVTLPLPPFLPTTLKSSVVLRPLWLISLKGRTIAEAVSRWLPTATARVGAQAGHVGFVVDKVTLGQVFSEYLGFPCQSSFHQILHHHNHPGLAHTPVGGRTWNRENGGL